MVESIALHTNIAVSIYSWKGKSTCTNMCLWIHLHLQVVAQCRPNQLDWGSSYH